MGSKSWLLIGEVVVPSRVQVGGEMTTYWKDFVMLAIGWKERLGKEICCNSGCCGIAAGERSGRLRRANRLLLRQC